MRRTPSPRASTSRPSLPTARACRCTTWPMTPSRSSVATNRCGAPRMRWRWPSPGATTATGATLQAWGRWLVWDGQSLAHRRHPGCDRPDPQCLPAGRRPRRQSQGGSQARQLEHGRWRGTAGAGRIAGMRPPPTSGMPIRGCSNTPGGVVDLRTGRQRPHDRADRMTKITTATPGGDCPTWRQFLDEVTGGDAGAARPTCSGWWATR